MNQVIKKYCDNCQTATTEYTRTGICPECDSTDHTERNTILTIAGVLIAMALGLWVVMP